MNRSVMALLAAAWGLTASYDPHALAGQGPVRVADVAPLATGPERPAWAGDDVPDSVWMLVEASVATADDAERKVLLRRAEGHARAAIVGRERESGAHFALAVVLGMRTEAEGGRTKVRTASALYESLERVLELDPEHPRAHHMMGRLHAGVRRMGSVTRWLATNLLGGDVLDDASWVAAERHLAFAEASAPAVADHHLQLARLFDDTGRPALAEAEAAHVLGLRARTPYEVAVRLEAEQLLGELGAKADAR